MLRLPSSKVRGHWWRGIAAIEVLTIAMCFAPMIFAGVCGSVAEAGGGVRAADGNLPLPSRRFITPEVGRSWRY
ncbi:hypothetical protein PF007_g3998 [Phytophthora fragariae]|uniref:Uncharacterized protein n=1 Tax=Phytophthora fragariae TaxID=53985 RepID=A0A6A3TCY6_9STRA|nr:hypothetical protein PF003_g1625 [Phytophthora fragariae]KAE9110485.1 hypothetical protein PF006_g20438 [Phytophthora fragariae]KAE9131715.1 hypothetical protein PF007_g3998 [Phytophthora fragariae]